MRAWWHVVVEASLPDGERLHFSHDLSMSFTVPSDDYKAPLMAAPSNLGTLQQQPAGGPAEGPTTTAPRARLACGMQVDQFFWLIVFCATGVGLGMSFEFMELHSPKHAPADPKSFFLCLIGYWSQSILGGGYALVKAQYDTGDWRSCAKGSWTRPVLVVLVVSALFDASAQALDYVGQVKGGYMLFTIFHSSVTVFSCGIAVLMLKTKISLPQWGGVFLIVAGVLSTAVPQPIAVPEDGSFWVGLICSVTGSLSLAASYPFSELVFVRGSKEADGAISEEMACCVGSLFNSIIYTAWSLVYTAPRWQEAVLDYAKPGEEHYMVGGYVLYGVMVASHSLSFWMSIHKLGTVPTAVAKGAQQAGVFLFSHIIYCSRDKYECIDYNT